MLALGLVFPRPAGAQQAGNVLLDSNEQLFCVLAALNASGYDTGAGADTGNNTRSEVRQLLAAKNLPIRGELHKFYEEHRIPDDPGADLGQYVSLALLLGPPPDFKLTVAETDLPPDAKALRGLVPLLKTFFRQADLTELWARVQPRYEDEVKRYSPAVRESVLLTDAYLRFPAGAYLGRTYSIYLALLGAPDQQQARIYGSNYYLVITPSKQLALKEIRHQYLHFLLDPLAVKYSLEIHGKAPLEAIARQAPALDTDFRDDFPLLVTECLIRAVELRMDKSPGGEKAANAAIGADVASGLILVPYFYDALQKYHDQDAAMNVYYKTMILGINVSQEQQRLASVQFAAEAPAAPNPKAAAPALTEKDRLLDQGDNLIYLAKYDEAKAVFQSVLEKFDPKNERALFGLAVAESNLRKPDLAVAYFKKTLDVARNLWIVTWAHIYLGRLYDLESERTQALQQYRAAELTAAGYPDAVGAVQVGLKYPFGTKH